MNDLLGGHVPVAFGVLPPALGNIAAGTAARHRRHQQDALLAVARRADLRRVGTARLRSRAALRAACAARHAAAIVDKLSAELRKLGNDPEVKKRIHHEGGDPLTSTPAEYADDIDREEKKWSKLVHQLGLKVE